MEMTMEEDSIEDNVIFCPRCHLALYPNNDSKKFFVLSCRVCNYEHQLDYEFSWDIQKVNKRSIRAHIRKQRKATCCPNALLTSVETRLNFKLAKENKDSTELLSADHLTDQYLEEEKRKSGSLYDGNRGYKLRESANVMPKKGVVTDSEYASKNYKGKDRCRAKWHSYQKCPFTKICQKILKGNAPFTSVPITKQWKTLKAGEMYIADPASVIISSKKTGEDWHAIVLIGFGREQGVEYFRFQNSHGTRFCQGGIGIVRAREICDIECFEPYYTSEC